MVYVCEMCGSEVDCDLKYCHNCGEFIEPLELEDEEYEEWELGL